MRGELSCEAVHAFEVVGEAHQLPFAGNLCFAPKQELPKRMACLMMPKTGSAVDLRNP